MVDNVCLTVTNDGHEVHDGMVEVGSVWKTVDGDSLVEQPDLRLGFQLAGRHHDGHGVRLLGNKTQQGRQVLVVVLLVTLVSPLHSRENLWVGVSDRGVDWQIEIILTVLGVLRVVKADSLRVTLRLVCRNAAHYSEGPQPKEKILHPAGYLILAPLNWSSEKKLIFWLVWDNGNYFIIQTKCHQLFWFELIWFYLISVCYLSDHNL